MGPMTLQGRDRIQDAVSYIALLVAGALTVVACRQDTEWSPDARHELLDMAARDQEIRAELTPQTSADTAFLGRMLRADSAHTQRLEALIDSLGWPRLDDVGREALEAAFLIIQHATDAEFKRRMLPVIETEVKAGHLNPQDFALLVDRTRQNEGLFQLYGTQLSLVPGTRQATLDPIEDSANVDDRREALGLPSLAEYLGLVEEQTGFDVVGHERPPHAAADTSGSNG